jgi:hypothetical protein
MIRHRRSRRIVLSGLAAVGLLGAMLASPVVMTGTSSADQPTGCDFVPTVAASCSPALAPSTFAAGDGNMLAPAGNANYTCAPTTSGLPVSGVPPCNGPGAFGGQDWQNLGAVNVATDIAPSALDNIWGPPSVDESQINVSITTGATSAGADLTRLNQGSEFVGGNNYLYLG